jgi:hypothetical protein
LQSSELRTSDTKKLEGQALVLRLNLLLLLDDWLDLFG